MLGPSPSQMQRRTSVRVETKTAVTLKARRNYLPTPTEILNFLLRTAQRPFQRVTLQLKTIPVRRSSRDSRPAGFLRATGAEGRPTCRRWILTCSCVWCGEVRYWTEMPFSQLRRISQWRGFSIRIGSEPKSTCRWRHVSSRLRR